MEIRNSIESDRLDIENIHKKAFGEKKGQEVVDLVNALLYDKTAQPILSLVAVEDEELIRHILFTKSKIIPTTEIVISQILAPLGVIPKTQNTGVGAQLIKKGLIQLKSSGVELVFVLGHPNYYPRSGFKPAGVLGYEAPYLIPEEHAGAWMVQELNSGVIGRIKGKVQPAEALDHPQHWGE